MRLSGVRLALPVLLLLCGVASAHPPPDPDPVPEPTRPQLEWSTWFRLGVGMKPADAPPIAHATTTPELDRGQTTTWDAALGIDVTSSISDSGNVRLGPWLELRGTSVVGGGELVIQGLPKKIDMFFYDGTGVLSFRGGANREKATGQIAYGYLAPWNLFHEQKGATRYMIGVRFVATYTRAIEDPRDWQWTVGLETEPVGALRYLLGIRSWY